MKKKFTFVYPLHAIDPKIFTQTKWVARTRIRKPKSKTNYQLKVLDLKKVQGKMTRKNEILQLIRELESLNEFFKNYLTQK